MKKRGFKSFIGLLLVTVLLLQVWNSYTPAVYAEDDFLGVEADAAMLVEASTGRILYQKNPDTQLGIASMTKMMTEYLLLEAVKEGRVTWDQTYTVSDYVYKISQNRGLSNVPLELGGQYNIRELYEAMAIYSANGATVAIAETIAGSETNFVKMMNEKAAQLGLTDYKFVNSTGLNNKDLFGMNPEGTSPTDENLVSARGVAQVAYHLLKDYPEVLETSSISKKVFREGTDHAIDMPNWNWMLPGLVYEYPDVDGLKTGSTDIAGYCFTGTAERNGMRYITVVMNAKSNGKGTYKARFDETRKLLDYAFSNFSMEEVLPAGFVMKGEKSLPVVKGKEKKVSIATKEGIKAVIKKGEKDVFKPTLVIDKKKLTKDGQITAPVKKGQKVGEVVLTYSGKENYGYITEVGTNNLKSDVITTGKVEKANWFVLSMRGIGGFFTNMFDTVKGWF